MLNVLLFTKIGNIWFPQDGATFHIAEATLDVLRPVFEDPLSALSHYHLKKEILVIENFYVRKM